MDVYSFDPLQDSRWTEFIERHPKASKLKLVYLAPGEPGQHRVDQVERDRFGRGDFNAECAAIHGKVDYEETV